MAEVDVFRLNPQSPFMAKSPQMANFGSLPVELVQKIIRCLLVDDDPPIVGQNAAAMDVLHWYKMKQALLEIPSRYELLQTLPRFLEEEGDGNAENAEDDSGSTSGLPDDLFPSYSLKNLRLTCRYLNQLCIPFLFQEVNLLTYHQLKHFSTIQELILIPYAKYIQVLRLAIGRRFPAASILNTCYNLRSLSVYIMHRSADCNHLVEPIRRLLGSSEPRDAATSSELHDDISRDNAGGKLTALGIYYQGLLNGAIDYNDMESFWDPTYCFNIAAALVLGILDPKEQENLSPQDDREVKESGNLEKKEFPSVPIETLDLVTGPISTGVWHLMQARLESLKSLTLRQALNRSLKMTENIGDKIWDPTAPTPCAFRNSLTRLYLRDCDAIEARDVPLLVQFFPSLTKCAIIACGNEENPVVERPRGWTSSEEWVSAWSLSPNSKAATDTTKFNHLGVQHPQGVRALDVFHVEHMDEEEMMALGVVPAHILMVVSRQIAKLLARDPEIFPCVKLLRTYAGTRQDPIGPGEEEENEDDEDDEGARQNREDDSGKVSMDSLCEARGIELRRDLPGHAGCGPECMYV